MYTLDYLKSLHVDLEVWQKPGCIWGEEDHFEMDKYFSDDELEPITELEDPIDTMDAIEELMKNHVEDYYAFGCIKRFTLKDSKGEIVGEVEPDYSDY